MNNRNLIGSYAKTFANQKFVRSARREVPRRMGAAGHVLLNRAGLRRRKSHTFGNVMLAACGAIVAAGAALLLAPRRGSETRSKLGERLKLKGKHATERGLEGIHEVTAH